MPSKKNSGCWTCAGGFNFGLRGLMLQQVVHVHTTVLKWLVLMYGRLTQESLEQQMH
jgi:hypothetical protein